MIVDVVIVTASAGSKTTRTSEASVAKSSEHILPYRKEESKQISRQRQRHINSRRFFELSLCRAANYFDRSPRTFYPSLREPKSLIKAGIRRQTYQRFVCLRNVESF